MSPRTALVSQTATPSATPTRDRITPAGPLTAPPAPPTALDWPTWGQRMLPAELDMGEVANELYAALAYIESLNRPDTESDNSKANANANPNTNLAPHTPIPSPNPA